MELGAAWIRKVMIKSDTVIRVDFRTGEVTPGSLCVAFDDQRAAPVIGPLTESASGRATHLAPPFNTADYKGDLKAPVGVDVAVCRAIARALPTEEAALLMAYYRISGGRQGEFSPDEIAKVNAALRAVRKAS
jgi:hypothetical protein